MSTRWRSAAAAACCAVAAITLVPLGAQDAEQPQRPPAFRSGTNVIRVDATVTDRSGRPVTDLAAGDFEIHEDGRPQAVTSFKFISADGQPGDDRSLAIRGPAHAAAEAAREDVRTFVIFWDEYHIEQFVNALRARQALTRAVLEEFGPTDLVAIVDQLTPVSAIEFTRDRRALADRVHTLQGRMGRYIPVRSPVEEAHLTVARRPGEIERFRTEVTITALKSMVAHLGTLGEGRKTLILVTESLHGFPREGGMMPAAGGGAAQMTGRDVVNMAIDVVRAANDSNVAIHVVDPKGLMTGFSPMGGALDTIANGTGGDLHRTNDAVSAIRSMIRQVSALYLLGYTREMPTDGRFHEIKVRVKRSGVEVRARAGYWAPRAEDIATARRKAEEAIVPPAVAGAFAGLVPAGAPRLVDLWTGVRPSTDGRSRVTVAWSPRDGAPPAAGPLRVTATAKHAAAEVPLSVEPGGSSLDVPPGEVTLAVIVAAADGEVLDRETRAIHVPDPASAPLVLSTPVVHRGRTPADLRAIAASADPDVHAGRTFARTDRLIVRVWLSGARAGSATVSASLLARTGASLLSLPVAAADGRYQVDLPLASVAAGEFAIAFRASSGDADAEAILPFRVGR